MFWLQIFSNFIKVLRSGQTPGQIAGGFALGAFAGFSPVFTLQGVLLWLLIFIVDVNLSAAFLSFTLFSLIVYLADPLFHELGYAILVHLDGLRNLWTTLYNAPIAPLTRFNNTLVMGSFAGALVLFPPIFLFMKKFVVSYRSHIHARIEKWKIYQIISKNSIVRFYEKIRDWGE